MRAAFSKATIVLVINMRAVKALGLAVPPGLLAIADEAIQ